MSIKTIILSLPNDAERRRSCERELESLGLQHEFTDAVCGDAIEDTELHQVYDIDQNRKKFKRPLSRSEVACTLGHRRIWQQIAESDEYLGLVLEDDATFVQDPRSFLQAIEQCPECFEDIMIKLDGVPRKNMQVLKAVADQSLVLSDHLPPRTTGYIIGRRAAARLAATSAAIARPVDIDLKFYWEHKVPILTLSEQMVSERQTHTSNIEAHRRKAKTGSPLHRLVRNLAYQVSYNYGRLSHPLKPDMIEGLAPLLQAQKQVRNHI